MAGPGLRPPENIMKVLKIRESSEVGVRRKKSQNTIIMHVSNWLLPRGITIGYLVFSNHTSLLNNSCKRKGRLKPVRLNGSSIQLHHIDICPSTMSLLQNKILFFQ